MQSASPSKALFPPLDPRPSHPIPSITISTVQFLQQSLSLLDLVRITPGSTTAIPQARFFPCRCIAYSTRPSMKRRRLSLAGEPCGASNSDMPRVRRLWGIHSDYVHSCFQHIERDGGRLTVRLPISLYTSNAKFLSIRGTRVERTHLCDIVIELCEWRLSRRVRSADSPMWVQIRDLGRKQGR